eukprot:g2024.t1
MKKAFQRLRNSFVGSSSGMDSKEGDEGKETEGFGSMTEELRENFRTLFIYAKSEDASMQRLVAEQLANEAVNGERQRQIVEVGGLKLLIPLTKSNDVEVQRLSAHALANLSVDVKNQKTIANFEDGEGIEMIIRLLKSKSAAVQRQAAKALANLGVNADNKIQIADKGGIEPLIALLQETDNESVIIETVAALANLAVDDNNEFMIGQSDATKCILKYTTKYFNNVEIVGQCSRALRNLSVNKENRQRLKELGAINILTKMADLPDQKTKAQALRALNNIRAGSEKKMANEAYSDEDIEPDTESDTESDTDAEKDENEEDYDDMLRYIGYEELVKNFSDGNNLDSALSVLKQVQRVEGQLEWKKIFKSRTSMLDFLNANGVYDISSEDIATLWKIYSYTFKEAETLASDISTSSQGLRKRRGRKLETSTNASHNKMQTQNRHGVWQRAINFCITDVDVVATAVGNIFLLLGFAVMVTLVLLQGKRKPIWEDISSSE